MKRWVMAAAAYSAALGAWADTETVGDYTWTYEIKGGAAEIVKYTDTGTTTRAISPDPVMNDVVVIPSYLGGCPVKSIGDGAFTHCTTLTNVTIPDSVTNIARCAFLQCYALTSVALPDGVTEIGEYAFTDCRALTSVTIPNSVTNIGKYAFCYCNLLSSITVPSGMKSIGPSAFTGCGMQSVTIPSSVTNIEDNAFRDCIGLKSVTIPGSVTSIGQSAFASCSNLTNVTISDGVKSIGEAMFAECGKLTNVTIPNSVTGIGDAAFALCSSLKSVTIPGSVTNIGELAFHSCSSLTNVTIPGSVTNIGELAFYNCSGLTSVTIPNSVTSIGESAFYNCSGLTSVTIPGSVTNIGDYAFCNCSGLMSFVVGSGNDNYKSVNGLLLPKDGKTLIAGVNGDVTIPDSVTSINGGAFSGCSGLTSVTIPDSVTSIGWGAFSGCSGLTNVTIPDSLTYIGNEAFGGCSNLTSVTMQGDWSPSVGEDAFVGVSSSCVVYLPRGNSTYSVSDGKWRGMTVEYYEAMPKTYSVTYNPGAYGSGSQQTATKTQGVALTLKGAIFTRTGYTQTGWATSDGGAKVYDLGAAYTADVAVTLYPFWTEPTLTIVDGVLKSVDLNGFTDVTIPSSVTSIGDWAFFRCRELTNVTIPNSVTNISDHAFYDCSGLTSVVIPSSVTSIGEEAFIFCSGLTSVVIPSSVTSIGEYAFAYCSGLTSVTMQGNCPTVGENAFYGGSSSCVVRLPQGNTTYAVANGKWQGLKVYVPRLTLSLKPVSTKYGTVSGGGTHAVGTKATLKAKAKSGYVFAGWFTDKACTKPLNPKGYDNRKATVKYAMPAKNTTVYAKFITKSAAKKSLKFSSGTKKLATTAKAATAGKTFALALGISSASLPTVTAKGLPKGFAIDKTTGEISGKGTVPGAYTATITVKDAAGNKITQKIKLTVSVPSWAKGSLYGYAVFESKSSSVRQKSCSVDDGVSVGSLKFTVGKTGKVSGKVLYNGKWHSFSSSLASCNSWRATFKPTIKVGSATFKYGTVSLTTSDDWGIPLTMASNSEFTFSAQKKPELVKKGKPLASLIGKTFTFTRKDKNSGLTKKNDKLTVKLGSGDTVTVSGTVDGRKLTAVSWPALLSYADTASETEYYELYVNIFDVAQTYKNTLYIGATVGPGGTAATATFPEF